MSILDDLEAASDTIDAILRALAHRDRRKACPRPCPDKKANKGRKGAKHVCELIAGDQMNPLERMRNAHPAQIQAQQYDRAGGRSSTTSDPTGRVAVSLVRRKDDEQQMRDHFANATRLIGIVQREIRRAGLPPKRSPEHRELTKQAKAARDAAHLCDLIVMRYPAPQPSTQSDRKRLAQANTTPPPDCQCCGEPVLMVGSAALDTDAGGNLPASGPTCDWCVGAARKLGRKPTNRMISDHKAGRRVTFPDANHVEAS